MGVFTAGEVVLLDYPFSDLSRSKLRPGLVLASAVRNDWIVCQITSNPRADATAIPLAEPDFLVGELRHSSCVRPGKIFTAHESLIVSTLGVLQPHTFQRVRYAVIGLIQGA